MKPSAIRIQEGRKLVQDIDEAKRISFADLKNSAAWKTANSDPPYKSSDITDCIDTFAKYTAKKGKKRADVQVAFHCWTAFKKNIQDTELAERDGFLVAGIQHMLSNAVSPSSRRTSGTGQLPCLTRSQINIKLTTP